jgi:hypothetical protein
MQASKLIFTTDYVQRALSNVCVYVDERLFDVTSKVLDQKFTVNVDHLDKFLQYLKMESWGENLSPEVPFLNLQQ